ncbi:MAG: DUF4435 domain-containing protein [Pseudohongiellaceae bacterium]
MLFTHPSHKNKTVFVVEGPSDLKFFQDVLAKDTTAIRPSGGKPDVIGIMNHFSKDHRVIGLCDADFDHILSHPAYSSNLILTDAHDLEMMMIEAGATDSITGAFAKYDALKKLKKNMVPATIEAALKLGNLRLLNEQHRVMLNFDGLSFEDFVIVEPDPFRLDVNVNTVLDQLFERSSSATKSKTEFSDMAFKSTASSYDKFQVCNGHDITEILSAVSKNDVLSENKINSKRIQELLRVAYIAQKSFAGTKMYKSIQAFEPTTGKLLN